MGISSMSTDELAGTVTDHPAPAAVRPPAGTVSTVKSVAAAVGNPVDAGVRVGVGLGGLRVDRLDEDLGPGRDV